MLTDDYTQQHNHNSSQGKKQGLRNVDSTKKSVRVSRKDKITNVKYCKE